MYSSYLREFYNWRGDDSNNETAAVAAAADAAAAAPITIHLQNMAGEVFDYNVSANETVGVLRQRLHDEPNFVEGMIEQIRLVIMNDDAPEVILDDNTRTLASYGVDNETTVHVVVAELDPGAHVRTYGSYGNGICQFNNPYNICLSPDGELLFVSDTYNHRIQVLRALDGSHVRTIGSQGSDPGQFNLPHGICLSLDGEFLIVADTQNRRVQILRSLDGTFVRSIGSGDQEARNIQFRMPIGVCLSMDRELLFIVDYTLQCVEVVRARDINLVGIIGEQGQGVDLEGPNSICVSHDNTLLFISDISNHRVYR